MGAALLDIGNFHRFSPLLLFAVSPAVFWPYFAGAVVLIVGLARLCRDEVRGSRGLETLIPFGPVLFAVAMAVFSGDHFGAPRAVSGVVPAWMPWHLFWTYFVGSALIAAALSMAVGKESQLAAALLGLMLFSFVLMIHIPSCFATPHDKTRFTVAIRDTALSAGALAFAASQAERWRRGAYRGLGLALRSTVWRKIPAIARIVIGVTLADFGIQQLLVPRFAPGIPQEGPRVMVTAPAWLPAHALWGYLSGAIFLVTGLALLSNRKPRHAASLLAAVVLVLVAFVYVPLTIQHATNIGRGLNYLAIHFALAGAALFLAGALPKGAAPAIPIEAEREAVLRGGGTAD